MVRGLIVQSRRTVRPRSRVEVARAYPPAFKPSTMPSWMQVDHAARTVTMDVVAGSDAADAALVPVSDVLNGKLDLLQAEIFDLKANPDRTAEGVVIEAKLDKDGNNLLTFEEWAVATSDRFGGADANGDGKLTPAEFATTAPRPTPRPTGACAC